MEFQDTQEKLLVTRKRS